MILLDNVVHILAGPAFTLFRQHARFLQIDHGTDIAAVFIDIDYSWGGDVGPAQDFAKEPLGCSGAADLIQEEIEGSISGINSPIDQNPGDLIGLARILGHESLETTKVYLRPTFDDLAQRMEQMSII